MGAPSLRFHYAVLVFLYTLLMIAVIKLHSCRDVQEETHSFVSMRSLTEFTPKHEYLVFSSVGSRGAKAMKSWTGGSDSPDREYDLVLYFFDPTFPAPDPEFCPADLCINKPGFKWPSLAHFISSHNLDSDSYKAVFAIDDDITMNVEDMNIMFSVFTQYELLFAQPSYIGELSDLHFPRIQRWRGNTVVRYTNFVENAAMVIDFKTVVTNLLPLMEKSGSGWGADYCFFRKTDPDVDQIATIHLAKAIHPPSLEVTKASNAFGVESKNLNKYGSVVAKHEDKGDNRRQGEQFMRSCHAFMFAPKVFFRVKPGEHRSDVIRREKENFPTYRAANFIKNPW